MVTQQIFMVLSLLAVLLPAEILAKSSHPHVIIIVADDLGWDDVSFHGSAIHTPNIDKLAYDGIILNSYYVSPICSPTRSALMTGLHPVHTGMQHEVIGGATPYGLPLDKKILPQYLKELGYATHIVGKWHLGHFAPEYLPLKRGFDTHFGYYTGHADYFDHTAQDSGFWGLDLRRGVSPVQNMNEHYSTEFFTKEAESIIYSHNLSQPLFLYLAHQAVHAGNFDGDPLQAPQQYVDQFNNIKNVSRRIFAGMAAALDESVGNVTRALLETGIMKDAIIIFTTDNGGPLHGYDRNFACNWPLRGIKNTLWEGGVRGIGFVYSPLLNTTGYVSENLFHVTDWLPTLYQAIGENPKDLGSLDGFSQWNALSHHGQSPRTEILHNIDPVSNFSAIRMGDYKLVMGNISDRKYDDWYPPPEADFMDISYGEPQHQNSLDTTPLRQPIILRCGPKPFDAATNCNPVQSPCLFHIPSDPCEFHNLADDFPVIVRTLLAQIKTWSSTMVPPVNKPIDPNGNPQLHGGFWGPWVS